jgi:BlaI family transcriptional regulator, penicillinase repressor
MGIPKLSRAEHVVMEALWSHGASSIREIQDALPKRNRRAYTTVQTLVYRLEAKGAVRRTKKIGGAHIFEAAISRSSAERRLVDELLRLFGGRAQPLMSHLIETGKLTAEDIEAAKKALESATKKE